MNKVIISGNKKNLYSFEFIKPDGKHLITIRGGSIGFAVSATSFWLNCHSDVFTDEQAIEQIHYYLSH